MRSVFLTAAIFVCAWAVLTPTARAQDAGGDLGGAGIFRPKNPETTSGRRANRTKPTAPPNPSRRTGGGARPSAAGAPTTAANAADVEERFEDALDEGNEARDARKFAEAERAYRSALKIKPRASRASYGLGNIYTDQQRWEEAERAYRDSVLADPANADAHVALSYVLVQPRSGGSLARRLADAETAARRAIQLQATNAVAHDRLGAALEERAILNSDTEQAYRRAIDLDPQFAVAHVHLARLLRKMKRAGEAEPYYRRATELANDAPTLVLIADALQSEQRYDDSEPLLRRAIEIDARNPGAQFLMGRMLVVKKRYQEAEPFLQSAIEVSPRSFSPYYILGSAYLRTDRFEDAERIYNRAADFAGAGDRKLLAGAFGLSGVGDGYMKAGRPADAARAYQNAVALDLNNTELQAKLAGARARQNR